jgi:hypothetical protein
LKIASAPHPHLLPSSISPGIFPYLGGTIDPSQLGSVLRTYGGAVVPGRKGAELAATVPGVLVDPAAYASQQKNEADTLFEYDTWLIRQRAAHVPLGEHRMAQPSSPLSLDGGNRHVIILLAGRHELGLRFF